MVFYCDLHGHSRSKNVFIYGNNYAENPEITRLFPFIMSKVSDSFSYESCRFNMHKSKESTARITMWRELKIPAVYTMEASFCGPQIGKIAGMHFTTDHLTGIGRALCLSLIIYLDIDVPKSLKEMKSQKRKKGSRGSEAEENSEIAQELKDYNRKTLVAELLSDKTLLTNSSKSD